MREKIAVLILFIAIIISVLLINWPYPQAAGADSTPKKQTTTTVVNTTALQLTEQLSRLKKIPPTPPAPPTTVAPNPVTPPTTPAVVPTPTMSSDPTVITDEDRAAWQRVAICETSGDWSMQGSSFSGGVGFANSTWLAYGGAEFAPNAGMATMDQQITVAKRIVGNNVPDQNGCAGGW